MMRTKNQTKTTKEETDMTMVVQENNYLQVFHNSAFGELGVMMIDGKPYFPATECARILGYSNPQDAIRKHCKGVRKTLTPSAGGQQTVNHIPEGDLYRLIIRSKLPAAQEFERWVFEEVLPSIRSHGVYATAETAERLMNDPDFMIKTFTALRDERTKRQALEKQIEAEAPKVLFAESVESSRSSILVAELAKLLKQNGVDIGQNRLFERLRQDGFLCSAPGERWNMPTQRAMEMGLFEIQERIIESRYGYPHIVRTTKVTGRGQVYFINKYRNAA